MEAGAGRVYLLPSDRPAIKESKEQLTLYAEGVKTKGRLHNMGSPHGYGAMGFVEGLNEDPDVPPESKAILAALARKNPSPQECGLSIPLFRLAKAYKDGIMKVRISYDPKTAKTELPELLDTVTPLLGGEVKSGDAPMGPRQRKIIEHFGLQKKMKDEMKD